MEEPVEGIIAGGIIRLKLKEDIEGEYLALCINSIIGKCKLTGMLADRLSATGNQNKLRNYKFLFLQIHSGRNR